MCTILKRHVSILTKYCLNLHLKQKSDPCFLFPVKTTRVLLGNRFNFPSCKLLQVLFWIYGIFCLFSISKSVILVFVGKNFKKYYLQVLTRNSSAFQNERFKCCPFSTVWMLLANFCAASVALNDKSVMYKFISILGIEGISKIDFVSCGLDRKHWKFSVNLESPYNKKVFSDLLLAAENHRYFENWAYIETFLKRFKILKDKINFNEVLKNSSSVRTYSSSCNKLRSLKYSNLQFVFRQLHDLLYCLESIFSLKNIEAGQKVHSSLIGILI